MDPQTAQAVMHATHDQACMTPDKAIDVQKVAERAGASAVDTKKVLYAMLHFQELTAAFRPRRRECGKVIGPKYVSAYVIQTQMRSDLPCSCSVWIRYK